jgi:exodeoxyribonuclease VII small subunit
MNTAEKSKAVTLEALFAEKNPEKLINTLKFEDGLKLIEELVSKVESGALDLESSINSYEQGMKILEHLKTLLAGAEAKLKVVNDGVKAG